MQTKFGKYLFKIHLSQINYFNKLKHTLITDNSVEDNTPNAS